jgi:hypothetical protein
MPRKRIADQEPVSTEGAAAAPAKAPAKRKSSEVKARAPRASATAVTHKHKKNATIENAGPVTARVEEPVSLPAPAAAEETPRFVAPPQPEEIAVLAYQLWEARGYQGGSPDEDWFTAERMLQAG